MGMSIEQMRQKLQNGESVSHGGRVITTEKDLPSLAEIDMDPGDAEYELGKLEQQIQDLQKQHAALSARIQQQRQPRAASSGAGEGSRSDQTGEGRHPAAPNGLSPVPAGVGQTQGEQDAARQRTAEQGQKGGRQASGQEQGEEPVHAGHKLSYYANRVKGKDKKAALDALEKIDGVGPATAQKILDDLDSSGHNYGGAAGSQTGVSGKTD